MIDDFDTNAGEQQATLYFAAGGYPIIGHLTFDQIDGSSDCVAITHICEEGSQTYLKVIEAPDVMEFEFNEENPFVTYAATEDSSPKQILTPKTAGLRIGALNI